MTTTTESKPTRTGKAHVTPQGVLVLTVAERGRVEEFCYWLDRIPSDYGAAFELRKFLAQGPETYHVCVDDGRGWADTCECKGFLRWNRCKHTSALRALLAAGKLPAYLKRPVCTAAPTSECVD